ncbi:MAG: ATP synthase F1 subunit epsilon [Bacteroidetes bacterium]|nr:ATP synthase F1 subunit epsilon [Bacteroidota bacterium]
MFLEIITPDKKVFSGNVTSVSVPGTNGKFQMLNRHAPIISTLVNGNVKVNTGKETLTYFVKGGVVEMLDNKVTLLAEGIDNNKK